MIIPIVATVLALVLTAYLVKRGLNIGAIMLINSAFVAIAAQMPLHTVATATLQGLFSERTISVIFILALVSMLENVMRRAGLIKQMVEGLHDKVHSPTIAGMLFPAILGLLPSPGGARFSCPMVKEVHTDQTPGMHKAFLNYWYRHIWIDGSLLYPGIILAARLSNVPLLTLSALMLVFSAFHILAGLPFVRTERVESADTIKASPEQSSVRQFFIGISAIFVIIVLYALLIDVTRYSLEISSLLTLSGLLIIKRYKWTDIVRLIREGFPLKYVWIIAGVMVFSEFLVQSGAIVHWLTAITEYHIPLVLLFFILPFICGFTSGLSITFVSLSFPILLPLGLAHNTWWILFAFVAGFAGDMVSPLHVCGIVSADYFGVEMRELLKRTLYAEVLMLTLSVVFLYVIGALPIRV